VSRRAGRAAASLIAFLAFASAGWAAYANSIPGLKVYDGYLMMIGATVAFVLVAPVVWRWPRERSLAVIAGAVVLGSMTPLAISAARHGLGLLPRLRGSWILAGADVVGPALLVGFICLWFALRDETPKRRT
jgi:hypothetical protein